MVAVSTKFLNSNPVEDLTDSRAAISVHDRTGNQREGRKQQLFICHGIADVIPATLESQRRGRPHVDQQKTLASFSLWKMDLVG